LDNKRQKTKRLKKAASGRLLPFSISVCAESVIPEWIALFKEDVSLKVHPEGRHEIQDHRASESEEREINEIEPDFGSGNIELFTQIGTNAKNIEFNEFTDVFHRCGVFKCKLGI
jgi:5,10-methylenetetrahydrofolate reductase